MRHLLRGGSSSHPPPTVAEQLNSLDIRQPRDAQSKKGQNKIRKKAVDAKCWTINVGGLVGMWRFIHHMRGVPHSSRPEVVLLQEVKCSEIDWKTTQRSIDSLGYLSYTCEGVGKGICGCVALVRADVGGRPHSSLNTSNGSAVAIEVGMSIHVNKDPSIGQPKCLNG